MTKIFILFSLLCIKTVFGSTFGPWLDISGYLKVSKDWNNSYIRNIQCESKTFENVDNVRLCSQWCWSQTKDNVTNKWCVSAVYNEFSHQCQTCVGYGCDGKNRAKYSSFFLNGDIAWRFCRFYRFTRK